MKLSFGVLLLFVLTLNQGCSKKNFTALNNCSNSDASSTDENCLSSASKVSDESDAELRAKRRNRTNISSTQKNKEARERRPAQRRPKSGNGSSSASNYSTPNEKKESCVDYLTSQPNYVAPIFKIQTGGISTTIGSTKYYSKNASGGVSVTISDQLPEDQRTLFRKLSNLDGMNLKSFQDGVEKNIFKESKILRSYDLKPAEKNNVKISYKWVCNYVTVAEFEEIEVNTVNRCGKFASASDASKLDSSIYDLKVNNAGSSSADEKIDVKLFSLWGFYCETKKSKIHSGPTKTEYTSIPRGSDKILSGTISATKQEGGWTFDSSYFQDEFISAYNNPNALTSRYPSLTAKEIIDNCDGELYASGDIIAMYRNSKTNEVCEIGSDYGSYRHKFRVQKP